MNLTCYHTKILSFMRLSKIVKYLLLLFFFLLPWQTRWIWHYGQLNGGFWEYGTFSLYGTEILLWAVIILFAIDRFRHKEIWQKILVWEYFRRRKKILFHCFIVSSLVAAAVALSLSPSISYNFVFHVLEGACLFVILVYYSRAEGGGAKFLPALWLGGVAQGLLALEQFLTQRVFACKWLGMAEQAGRQLGASVVEFGDGRWLRAYGSFGSPNSLGIYLAALFVLGLILYINATHPRIKILLSTGQLFILTGLLLSFSRGAWIAAVAGVISLLVILYFKKEKKQFSGIGEQLSASVLLIILLIFIFYPVFAARFNIGNRLELRSLREREAGYSEGLFFLQRSNFLFGVGPGVFTLASYQKFSQLSAWQYQPAHNIYLLILVEWGLAGAVLFAIFHIKFLEIIVKNNLIFLPLAVTLIFSGVFDHWLWSMYTGVVFWWAVWGLALKENIDLDVVNMVEIG